MCVGKDGGGGEGGTWSYATKNNLGQAIFVGFLSGRFLLNELPHLHLHYQYLLNLCQVHSNFTACKNKEGEYILKAATSSKVERGRMTKIIITQQLYTSPQTCQNTHKYAHHAVLTRNHKDAFFCSLTHILGAIARQFGLG